MAMTKNEAICKLMPYDQLHLLHFYDKLPDSGKDQLLSQIECLDLSLLDHLSSEAEAERGKFEPLGALTIDEIKNNENKFREIGLNAIREGKAGCILLAGGQGSRLGFDHPKGMFNIGVNRELYIFECLFRNLMEVTEEAGSFVHLFIMTSESNDIETREFLEENKFFGYSEEYVHFFVQEMAPVGDDDKKILMTAPDAVAMSPNGNGGWFSSLVKAGLLDKMEQLGVEWLNVFSVDNVLQKIADPVFVGATIEAGCVCGSKVVAKANPNEKVGVLCLEDGRPSIVEYYEMTDEIINSRDEEGKLLYNYGVILNYLFEIKTLTRIMNENMPTHVVEKKIPYMDEDGSQVKPAEPNGYKFETLVLDMIHMMDNCLSFEVERNREFAPIKNRTGVDSLDSARELMRENGIEF